MQQSHLFLGLDMDVDLSDSRCRNVTRYLLVRASCLVGLLLALGTPVISQDFASQDFLAQTSNPRSYSRSVNIIPAAVRFDSPVADDAAGTARSAPAA